MTHPAHLLSVATAAPPHILVQTDVEAAAQQIFGARYASFSRMAKVFGTTGIRKRHSVRPIEWFTQARGWPERTAAYLEGALGLFIDSSRAALDKARLKADQVDIVVTVSSTGIATPSLEAQAMGAMGFRPDIQRVPVFGLGCGGGTAGFAIAAKLAEANPGAVVLLVVVELCTLSFRLDELTKANMVATALFGDGGAACVLRAGPGEGLAQVQGSGQHTWADTLDIMGWRVDPEGFGVIFAQAIPPFAEANMGPAVDGMLGRLNLARGDIDRYICHPGGTKVLTALELALNIEQGSLDDEREVLADYGNMSAPTVLFVLERQLAKGLPKQSALLALGPGFSASCAVLKAAA
ncbi:alkylresorcinol/alkylpyrone synthase [Caulobacter ginsengisoli]|uniref:Alkylresorcinol/alkylpyrone synthase n=1 Tax=Caulobacter ginsengisoli TaxID=400775 RepID=A0ABU0IQM4_9CAUL|nr:type III polyketide synthase [Caulobacter ginsengisoli]MDQ0464317.1 alkylresorcinol/alkylpyrone synthase [Caulobacter ginsengisoli]